MVLLSWVKHIADLVGEKKNSVLIPEYVEKLEEVRMEVHSKFGFGTAATDIGAKEKVPRNIKVFLDRVRKCAQTAHRGPRTEQKKQKANMNDKQKHKTTFQREQEK